MPIERRVVATSAMVRTVRALSNDDLNKERTLAHGDECPPESQEWVQALDAEYKYRLHIADV